MVRLLGDDSRRQIPDLTTDLAPQRDVYGSWSITSLLSLVDACGSYFYLGRHAAPLRGQRQRLSRPLRVEVARRAESPVEQWGVETHVTKSVTEFRADYAVRNRNGRSLNSSLGHQPHTPKRRTVHCVPSATLSSYAEPRSGK